MSVLLFPGQGSQFVGMAAELVDVPNVRDMFDRASQILDYDLLRLCLEGPEDREGLSSPLLRHVILSRKTGY